MFHYFRYLSFNLYILSMKGKGKTVINLVQFETNIKKGVLKNLYVFCGSDENLIKQSIEKISKSLVGEDFKEFNFIRLDGRKVDNDIIVNACETMPFMGEQKVVEVFRANFLDDAKSVDDEKTIDFNKLLKYTQSLPPYTTLIMYYIFKSDRDKPSSKVKKLEKNGVLIKVDKVKGNNLYFKAKEVFESKGKKIDKSELSFFCSLVEGNMNIINNEVEKLCCYCEGRNITKEDILLLMSQKNENDIFNLVDYISQKNIKKSIDVLNELIYKGQEVTSILYMIQRQFRLLLSVRVSSEKGESIENISRKFRLHPYIAEKMIGQSKKFTLEKLKKNLELALEVEGNIKSLTTNNRIQLEFFIINSMI
ncbi:DNA polymerase III subunit delta [Clostridium senegalense]|nr:DNA polymerase III subunit delta [Clostridium senegalense]MBU5225482.1 DNA polymerase III subunit delta [Clostridium senegalense]